MVRQMRLGTVAVACMLASLLWSQSTCYLPPERQDIYDKGRYEWKRLDPMVKKDAFQREGGAVICQFFEKIRCIPYYLNMIRWQAYLFLICSKALGDDIEIEFVGSFIRGTASTAPDLDYHVRRTPSSKRFGEPWTQEEKEKLAEILEKWKFVLGPVEIGNVSIKFNIDAYSTHGPLAVRDPTPFKVDLVLVSGPQSEDWQNLRGGKNRTENSKHINSFLERTPAARYAIMLLKYVGSRPKSILLEAIAWRLSETYEGQLTTCTGDPEPGSREAKLMALEGYSFFQYMLEKLRDWEESPFGSDLMQDLDMLPDHKRKEHIDSFEKVRQVEDDEFEYLMVWSYIAKDAHETWTRRGNYTAHLKREVRKFFRSVGGQKAPRVLGRGQRAPRGFG